MIDVRSPTTSLITKLLYPLEHATHIHIILDGGTGVLEVYLPRLKLDFLVNEPGASLESKQFRGIAVDDR